MSLPSKIKQWLNDRGLTDKVITANHLDWNGTQIVIPIYDSAGNYLYNKYRRDPFGPTDVPKYKYDPGTTAQLYNAHKITDASFIIVLEGELDALRLESEGFIAVTSTGGAGTFKDEWLKLLKGKEVYVCFDDDSAGYRGAIKLLTKINAKLIVLPQDKDVKDITEFFKKYTSQDFRNLINQARSYPILSEPIPEFKYLKNIDNQIKKYKTFLDQLLNEEHEAKNNSQPFYFIDHIRSLINIAINNLSTEKRRLQRSKRPIMSEATGDLTPFDIQHAKDIHIELLYGGQLKRGSTLAIGLCPFHNEKHGSFTVFTKQNRWFCFGGCQAGGDSIDYIQRRDACDFITAVKKLLNK